MCLMPLWMGHRALLGLPGCKDYTCRFVAAMCGGPGAPSAPCPGTGARTWRIDHTPQRVTSPAPGNHPFVRARAAARNLLLLSPPNARRRYHAILAYM